ncbi:MAG: ATP-dependent Clp protease ATP-binding subunit [bacterium]
MNQSSDQAAQQPIPQSTTMQLRFESSRRATRIAGTAWLVPQWRRVALKLIMFASLTGAVLLLVFRQSQLALLCTAPAFFVAPAWFWGNWGMKQFSGQDVIASGSTNLNELLTADLVKPLKRIKSSAELWGFLSSHWQAQFMINHLGIPLQPIEAGFDKITAEEVFVAGYQAARDAHQRRLTAGSLVIGMIQVIEAKTPFLAQFDIHPDDLHEMLIWLQHLIHDRLEKTERNMFGGLGRDFAAGYTNYLDRFGKNMSDEVESGHGVYSSLGREGILDQMITSLNQSVHPAAALVGPIGSGKTTLVYSFAEQILSRTDVGRLTYRKVMMLSATALLSAATPETPIEKIINEVLADAVRAKNVVLFFDEAQAFFSTKAGSTDISEILLPILQNTHLPMIFAFTEEDWNRFSQIRPNLMSQIAKLVVPPADRKGTIRTLQDVALEYEAQEGLLITLSALKEASTLSERYVTSKTQPGAAIDLLRAAFGSAQNGVITEVSVRQAVEKMTGVKAGTADPEEAQKLLHLESFIHERMINQTVAVTAVASALRRARSGVKDPNRPIGSFLFLGPTGVGKTELAKSLAAVYFSGEDKMIRLDMSEYQQVSDVTRILAAATESGAGSSFLEQVRQQPYSVVLLDEIEKASPDILNLILQMLDEGRLTDTAGKPVSFKDCIIILTSNALADDIRQAVAKGEDLAKMHDEIIEKLIAEQIFKPELLNRFDEVVTFRPLTADELKDVVGIMLRSLNKSLEAQQITVELTDDAKVYVVEQGNDPRMGARPMRRALQRFVEDRLSQGVLKGEIKPGAKIVIDRKDIETPVA